MMLTVIMMVGGCFDYDGGGDHKDNYGGGDLQEGWLTADSTILILQPVKTDSVDLWYFHNSYQHFFWQVVSSLEKLKVNANEKEEKVL